MCKKSFFIILTLILVFSISCCTSDKDVKQYSEYELLIKISPSLSQEELDMILNKNELIEIERIKEINIIRVKFKQQISEAQLETTISNLGRIEKIEYIEKNKLIKAIQK